MMQTLNQDGSNGEPYANHFPDFYGHRYVEPSLVIPIREWDDAEAARTVGVETRYFSENCRRRKGARVFFATPLPSRYSKGEE
jgi:hypothetical protein